MADFFEGLEVSAGETGDPNIQDPTIAGTCGGTIDFRNLKDAEQSADPQVTGSLEGDDFFKGLFISDPAAEGSPGEEGAARTHSQKELRRTNPVDPGFRSS